MRNVKSMMLTVLCAAAILAAGYGGLLFCGEQVLKSSPEPELVTMEGNISTLFYSRLEDDIQLYPWNYYPEEENPEIMWNTAMEEYGWPEDLSYLESEVFYHLIGMAADVNVQEVSHWYEEQDKSIWEGMKEGVWDNQPVGIFFYDEVIRLYDREYEVKIACDPMGINSFSCIPVREAGVKDTGEWEENREEFLKEMEKNSDWVLSALGRLYSAYWNRWDSFYWDGWSYYVEMFRYCQEDLSVYTQGKDPGEASWDYRDWAEAYGLPIEEEIPIQMIELSNCLLLLMEQDTTVGFYYDVLEQRVVGFHIF